MDNNLIIDKINDRKKELNDIYEKYERILSIPSGVINDIMGEETGITEFIVSYYLENSTDEEKDKLLETFDHDFAKLMDSLSEEEIVELGTYYHNGKRNISKKAKIIDNRLKKLFKITSLTKIFDAYVSRNMLVEKAYENKKEDIRDVLEDEDDYTAFNTYSNFINELIDYTNKYKNEYNSFVNKYEMFFQLAEKIENSDNCAFLESLTQQDYNVLGEEVTSAIFEYLIDNQKSKELIINSEIERLDAKLSKEHFSSVLRKYDLTIKMFERKDLIISLGKEEEMAKSLEYLKSINYDFKNNVNDNLDLILILSNSNNINSICRLVNKNYLSLDTIYNHKEIFFDVASILNLKEYAPNLKNALYERVMANYDVLKSFNITPDDNYNEDVLLIDQSTVLKNAKLLVYYNDLFKSTNMSCFLANNKMFDLADLLIDMGINTNDINLADAVKYNINLIIKRIKIATSIGNDIFTSKNNLLNSILTGKSFIVPDSELDAFVINKEQKQNYMINRDVLQNEYISLLENNYKADGVYVFSDVIVSRGRFLRNISDKDISFDTIIDALLLNGNYSNNDKEKIIDSIKSMIK